MACTIWHLADTNINHLVRRIKAANENQGKQDNKGHAVGPSRVRTEHGWERQKACESQAGRASERTLTAVCTLREAREGVKKGNTGPGDVA